MYCSSLRSRGRRIGRFVFAMFQVFPLHFGKASGAVLEQLVHQDNSPVARTFLEGHEERVGREGGPVDPSVSEQPVHEAPALLEAHQPLQITDGYLPRELALSPGLGTAGGVWLSAV